MRNIKWKPRLPTPIDSTADQWHTLTLDVGGNIKSTDKTAMHVLGPQADSLPGRAIKSVIPELPFSEETPGYNLAYAVFHGVKGAKIRRTIHAENGQTIPVDTVLSCQYQKGDRSITLRFRSARP